MELISFDKIMHRLQSVWHVLTSKSYLIITPPFDIAQINADHLEFYEEHLELALDRVREFKDIERLNRMRVEHEKAKSTSSE